MGRHRQISIALDAETRDELEERAIAVGRSIADEIRRRIERTLYEDKFDPETRDLAFDIMTLAAEVEHLNGIPWHKHPKAHQALAEAVMTWLDGLTPKDPQFSESFAATLFRDDPRTVGRTLARSLRLRKQADFTRESMLPAELRVRSRKGRKKF